MTLTLRIRNVAFLDNGMPIEFVLHRRGAVIGRAPTCDWSLPDPTNHISSHHCDIRFSDEGYVLLDRSTNGTFLNGSPQPIGGEHRLVNGDVLQIGQYEVVATLTGAAVAHAMPEAPPPQAADDWYQDSAGDPDWGSSPSHQPPASPSSAGFSWGPAPASPTPPPQSEGWAPSHRAPDVQASSPWDTAAPAPEAASGWSSAAPDRPPAPRAEDVWGKIAEGNVVDWARGGFGQPRTADPSLAGIAATTDPGFGPASFARPVDSVQTPVVPPAAPQTPAARGRAAPPRAQPAAPGAEQVLSQLLAAAGVSREQVAGPSDALADQIGMLLVRLVSGLVVMLEARARAKSQMGAESTSLEFEGNNPIKFARSPEQALVQLLNPQQRGFLSSERAVEDAFFDLQSHQMATLKAMQGALRATLERFSPSAIKQRATSTGGLSQILPGGKKAALWDSYEREFSGVAQGSDEAFMDVFAKEFRKAYEEQSRSQRRR